MADIRIRNGRVFTPAGPIAADVLVTGERIAGFVTREDPTPAHLEIDARGREVLPGVIDLHTHVRVPGYEYKEDYLSASRAAALGGVTTFVDMPNVEPPTDSADLLRQKRAVADRDCLVDWGHFGAGTKPDNVEALAEAGAAGFKIFQIGGAYPHDPRLSVNAHDQLYRCFEAIARTGLPCVVHPFDQALFDLFSERAWAAGRPRDHIVHAEVYTTNDIIWRSAVRFLLDLQRDTGARLHLLHTHAKGSLRALKQAKAEGQPVTVAIDPKYFHLRFEDLVGQGPRCSAGGFVTQDEERMRLIWESLSDGTIDLIDSDHAPHLEEEVEKGREDAWEATWGSPEIEHYLMLLLNDVNQGRLTLERLVRLMSENPARVIGVYPEKGALLPGSYADMVIVDMAEERLIRDEDTISKPRWTPYRDWRIKGVPVLTMLRGTVIARDGRVVGEPGYGRFIAGRPQRWTEPLPGQSPGLALTPSVAASAAAVPVPV